MAKFQDAKANKYTFFPNSSDAELGIMKKHLTMNDFKDGSYAYNMVGKESRDNMMEMPPFEDRTDAGEEVYNKYFSTCFTSPSVVGDYPKFDEKTQKVVTLSSQIVSCAKKAGLKGYTVTSNPTINVEDYMAQASMDAGKKVNIKIDSAAAAAAYEAGKKGYYNQRGYFSLSCANCHVQGAGERVRLEYLSPLLGAVTHFPVYRTGKDKQFTLEGRLKGCTVNMGQKPYATNSDWSYNVLYFMSYMSNGVDLSGPDVRR